MATKKARGTSAQAKGKEAEELILDYMKQQYRPYSVADIVLNLNGQINKANAIKALENLSSRGELVCKVYGKSTYYVYKEISCEEDENTHFDITERVKTIEQKNKDMESLLASLENEYKQILETPNDEMLVLQVSQLESEVQALQERESAFKGAENEGVNEDTLNKYNDYSAALMKEYTSRKRMFQNFVEVVKEGADDFEKFMDKIGIDMDEAKAYQSL